MSLLYDYYYNDDGDMEIIKLVELCYIKSIEDFRQMNI